MEKAVMMSIRPKWVEKIANGKKTIEVRKTKPKLETPFKCYIYCTNIRPFLVWGDVFRGAWFTEFTRISGYSRAEADKIWDVFNGHIAGEFTCERIVPITYDGGRLWCPTNAAFSPATCLSQAEIIAYIGDRGRCYGWHISDLRIYDPPKELSEFTGLRNTRFGAAPYGIKRPPQSWCYVEEG